MIITQPRVYLPTHTLGSWYDEHGTLFCKTMELPWRDNRRNVSCIPEGLYDLVKLPPGYGRNYWYFRFKFVAGRTMNIAAGMSTILVHRITFVKHLKGCIGVGGRFVDWDNDGILDIADSSKKLQWLVDVLPDEFQLNITKKIT